jgi:hypothetical protein
MNWLGFLGGLFIPRPGLAVVPAVVFAVLYHFSRRKLVLATATAWGLYALYEYAMLRRWMCSGECNIRIDLLVVYPALVLLSLAAAVVAVRAMLRRRG